MGIYKNGGKEFNLKVEKLLNRFTDIGEVEDVVREIGNAIKKRGDEALIEFTRRWDRNNVTPETLMVSHEMIKDAWRFVEDDVVEALKVAAERIENYQRKKLPLSWFYEEEDAVLGERITPLERVGIYVPGGKASYPSTVLMNAIPAKVAGVEKVIMVTPFPDGEYDPAVLVAADIAGVDEIYKVGGAQAIFALAYGTETIPMVDKIVGPGNLYVATAKKMVYGLVDIDMVAGPSEILVVAEKGDPRWIAADLMSQAEHDEAAYPVCLTDNEELAEAILDEFEKLLEDNPRKEIIKKSWEENGGILLFDEREEMYNFANDFAPEHLELLVENVEDALSIIKNAGAIFIGDYTTEPVGDYMAGPNHTLPTGGTARFFSPLGVEDFIKRSSLISVGKKWVDTYGDKIVKLARQERLVSHSRAVKIRLEKR